jgi:hypothetical protein
MTIADALRLEISLHRQAADALFAALTAIEAVQIRPLPNLTVAAAPSAPAAPTNVPAGVPRIDRILDDVINADTHPGQLFDTAPNAQEL